MVECKWNRMILCNRLWTGDMELISLCAISAQNFEIFIIECEKYDAHIKLSSITLLIWYVSKNNTEVASLDQRKTVGDNVMADLNTLSENEPLNSQCQRDSMGTDQFGCVAMTTKHLMWSKLFLFCKIPTRQMIWYHFDLNQLHFWCYSWCLPAFDNFLKQLIKDVWKKILPFSNTLNLRPKDSRIPSWSNSLIPAWQVYSKHPQ